jgi:hypothetical protein
MADCYRTPDGRTVEVVQLAEGERLRIRHYGYYIADVRSVPDLGRWIPQNELERLERDMLILVARPKQPRSRSLGRGRACTRPTDTPRPGHRWSMCRRPSSPWTSRSPVDGHTTALLGYC